MSWKKLVIPILVVLIGYVAMPFSSDATELPLREGDWNEQFQSHVDTWIGQLSKDPSFVSWVDADREIQSMGPGTHQWLVTLKQKDSTVGYMIIAAAPFSQYDTSGNPDSQIFILVEYGTGEYTLFDPSVLKVSAAQAEIAYPTDVTWNRWYGDALHALWWTEQGGEKRYFDAKSGEMFPITEQDVVASVDSPNGLFAEDKLLNYKLQSSEGSIPVGWASDDSAPINGLDNLKNKMSKGSVQYIASLYEDKVLAPFEVVGFHEWDSLLFVAVSDNGVRYIPADVLLTWGEFYGNPSSQQN